ncbi:MAG: hypothetical protein WC979_00540 [Candidatus Pacearchaeota archaeon]|jgi:hypothetical protein|nr:hypothetical protein [Clostridia bacterium]
MKNYKRALRREQKRSHIIRRVKIWHGILCSKHIRYAEYLQKVFNGERDVWMRTQSVPCSCYCCSGEHKYRITRSSKNSEVAKFIDDCIEEEMQK